MKRLTRSLCAIAAALASPALAQSSLPVQKSALVPFEHAPFPYRGMVPKTGAPFLDVVEGERRGRTTRGGILWEETFSDRRVLMSIPRGFDARRPALIVVYFHGNGALLDRDVLRRQAMPRQVAESGLNAVLVAPQFARDAADSSAGHFWEPGAFRAFLDEAAGRLARLHGNPRARTAFERAPVIIVAYSGGYHPTSFSLTVGGARERVRGVVLLDALYGDHDRYLEWLSRRPQAFFLSAYGSLVRGHNTEFMKLLVRHGIPFTADFPPHLVPGMVSFMDLGAGVKHQDFVTQAWSPDPVKVILSRVPGYVRR